MIYIYNIINYDDTLEIILTPFILKKSIIDDRIIPIDKYTSTLNIRLDKCTTYKITYDKEKLDIIKINESHIDTNSSLEMNDNIFYIWEDYHSFILYTKNDRYEYCSYCNRLANKEMSNCCICYRKKCGSCEDFKNICDLCNTNIIL